MKNVLILPFIFSFILLTLVGCETTPDNFYQNDLASLQESDVYLSIESQPDGSGVAYSEYQLNCKESATFFAILRDAKNNTSLGSMEVEWANPQNGLEIAYSRSNEASVIARKSAPQVLKATYNDQFKISAQVVIEVEGICGVPITPYEYINPENAVTNSSGHVITLKGIGLGLVLHSQNSGPSFVDDEFPYLEFSDEQSLVSDKLIGIRDNSERTVIAVAMPYDFGEEYSPYHPPIESSPTMIGFGSVNDLRSIYDLNFYGNGEFITNFYGPTAGYDDSYNYLSPRAVTDRVQIFTSRYQWISGQYYGQNSSYIDGELGNQIWTRLQSSDGKLYLGRGAYNNSTYVTGFEGRIYEVLIYNRALDDSELEVVHQYLKQKYQL